MAKRNSAADVMSKFGELNAQATPETHSTDNTHEKHGTEAQPAAQEKRRPGRPPGKKNTFRYNLSLDKDLDNYLYNIAWQNHMSMTQYINNLIRKDMKEYYAGGGTETGWIDHTEVKGQ